MLKVIKIAQHVATYENHDNTRTCMHGLLHVLDRGNSYRLPA